MYEVHGYFFSDWLNLYVTDIKCMLLINDSLFTTILNFSSFLPLFLFFFTQSLFFPFSLFLSSSWIHIYIARVSLVFSSCLLLDEYSSYPLSSLWFQNETYGPFYAKLYARSTRQASAWLSYSFRLSSNCPQTCHSRASSWGWETSCVRV